MEKAQVYAKFNSARISPKKVAIVLDLIRGRNVKDARIKLTFDQTKAASMVLKTLNSALANAKNNNNLKESNLYISETYVNGGPVYKRGRIVAKSRFSPILKRTSHIVVGLSERNSEGKK